MQCGSCTEEIPQDSIFCPECGARQEMSRAGGLPNVGATGLGGQEVGGGRNFGVVSGEAVMNQNMGGIPNQGMPPGMMPDLMGQVLPNMQGNNLPPPNMQQGGLPPVGVNPGNMPPPGMVTPLGNQPNIGGSRGDLPQGAKGPSLASGIGPNTGNGEPGNIGGMAISNNPTRSPTDAMVNHLAETERAVKNERRSQWLQMNQESAANVLSSIGSDLPSHLKGTGNESSAAEFLANAIGSGKDDSGNEALFKRMSEVAVRRVARKRGVAVETPQISVADGVLTVSIVYVDDGRVLDTPEDLSSAFEHAISTEIALKGLDVTVKISLSRSKDGAVESLSGQSPAVEEVTDEEMFACEECDGLVKESDNECPHCGAIFEEEDDEPVQSSPRGSPPGPSRGGGPPGPSRGGGPPGPSRGGGPPGPSRGGGPPKRSGPPSKGPSGGGPPKRSGPPSGGPSGGGPPGPSRSGGPPKRSGPPSGGPSGAGPPGPKKSGGPPKGGPGGGPPGPKKRGPPSGPKRGPPR
ncbi:MAG: zinc ribbon domain-containing protein [Euryarchaeota archaeon]